VENLLKRGQTPFLGALVGALFGALLTAYLFITGILDVTRSGYPVAGLAAQALPRAAKDLVPWLLIWLFVTPAIQRIRFGRPWIALVVSAALGVVLVPRLLAIDNLSATQLGALFFFGLVLTLPVVRASDVWLSAAFFIAMHIVAVTIMGMPFGSLGEGVYASRLHGDDLITGGALGPVFGFAGMLGQVWLAAATLRHQHLLFAGAARRVAPRREGLRQFALGLALAAAAAAVLFVLTLLSGQARIAGIEISVSAISSSLTTALPVAIASVILSCAILTTTAYAVVRRGWIAAIIATAIAVALHLLAPGTNLYTAFGAGALTLAATLAFAGTGRLWLPVGLSYGWFLFEGPVFGFPTNGFPIGHPWFQQQMLEYTTLAGGVIGPAASVFATAAKCLLVIAVIVITRSEKLKGA
jgi:hypothetical protein